MARRRPGPEGTGGAAAPQCACCAFLGLAAAVVVALVTVPGAPASRVHAPSRADVLASILDDVGTEGRSEHEHAALAAPARCDA